ncbi:MAG: adenylyltransferase/cytidyltransferase family protein, partial [Anaeroplasmataceae bacterium]|nr:adenylyltransferase/cytidyltransferase family protein [Anaeroplasmataceae bacterium]
MKTIHIKDNDHELITDSLCAAIGNFDGVHLGHQKLIEECKRHGYKSAVLTFYPHPSVFLKKIPDYKLITPIEHKADILAHMGIDYLIIIEFNDDIAKISKESFILWMKRLNIKSCVCGYDFTFGRKAEGTIIDLAKEFEFYEVKKFIFDDVRVSSTYIRELLSLGDVSKVNRMLGRTFSIRGKVNYGTQNGRLIGFPTANVDYKNYFLPANGVYFVTV